MGGRDFFFGGGSSFFIPPFAGSRYGGESSAMVRLCSVYATDATIFPFFSFIIVPLEVGMIQLIVYTAGISSIFPLTYIRSILFSIYKDTLMINVYEVTQSHFAQVIPELLSARIVRQQYSSNSLRQNLQYTLIIIIDDLSLHSRHIYRTTPQY